jgi:predicted Zn-dependent protease
MNMINIENLLSNCNKITDYKITSEKTESYELFFVHKSLETVRSTDTENITVTVYVDHDGKKGSSEFSLYASTTDKEAEKKIATAAENALHVNNEYYTLPENEVLDGEIASNFAEYDMPDVGEKIAEAVFAADNFENGSVNALEVFVNKHIITIKNSRNINKRCVKYSAMAEVIPTWNEGESVELYECKHMSMLDEDDITREIHEKMVEVRERSRAKKPENKISCPVMLDAPELSQTIYELVKELGYASVYAHSNYYSLGDKIQKEPRGDKLNVTMRGVIEGSVASSLFDSDGVALKDTTVIKDGVAVSYLGSHRFAQYLGEDATGMLTCIDVDPGTLSEDELKSAPYFRCVSMSGIQLDLFNDYIGGEIRLGYYYDGKESHPISGISISGSLTEALNSMRLSDVVVTQDNYRGPKFALFNGIEIV